MPSTTLAHRRRSLLNWYHRHRRDLPWRHTRDAYRIWVSEIMLQQTRIDVVIPYWHRFLERFPTVSALAEADEAEVLSEWSGLGYYRRARMLHRAAGEVVREHGGQVPDDPESVRALPGVGRYTAGAILSIAFDRQEPILDGNVIRVLCRLLAWRGDPARQPLNRRLWEQAAELVAGPQPGALNQALMELGALICTPVSEPACADCPLHDGCEARRLGRVRDYPETATRPPPREEHWTVAVCKRRGRYLLRQRRGETLMEGLWELPSAIIRPQPKSRAATALSKLLDCEVQLGASRYQLTRSISGRKIQMHAHFAEITGKPGSEVRWWTAAQANKQALTTTTRRMLEAFEREIDKGVQPG